MSAELSSSESFDVAIVGAGIVGCAVARRFTLDGARVIVLEKAADVLDGASKANSAILHTGFDAPSGSLEQACIARGYREFLDIHAALGLPVLKTGALVLAWTKAQLDRLPTLVEKAHANGVGDVVMRTRDEIRGREPHLSDAVLGGFEVPGEYLIDPWTTGHVYLLQALANGATLKRETEIVSGSFDNRVWQLETSQGHVRASWVISCAGLYGDEVDRRLTGASRFTIRPRKGQFVVFDKAASDLASAILLPVPTETTKGVVVCRTIFGNLLVGPTAEDQESRADAATDAAALTRLRETGMAILPELEHYEVTAAYAGIRPASDDPDYQIHRLDDMNYISVGGIRSTGLSAALGIARHVADLAGASACPSPPLAEPAVPPADRLSAYHRRDWEEPGNGGIICHCELVTRREIDRVLKGSMAPATLPGLKRRTRVCMGRCQGFYCTGELAEMTQGHIDPPLGRRQALA